MDDADQDRERITDPDAADEQRARQLFNERGVVASGHQDAIDDVAQLRAEWAAEDEPLR